MIAHFHRESNRHKPRTLLLIVLTCRTKMAKSKMAKSKTGKSKKMGKSKVAEAKMAKSKTAESALVNSDDMTKMAESLVNPDDIEYFAKKVVNRDDIENFAKHIAVLTEELQEYADQMALGVKDAAKPFFAPAPPPTVPGTIEVDYDGENNKVIACHSFSDDEASVDDALVVIVPQPPKKPSLPTSSAASPKRARGFWRKKKISAVTAF